MEPKVSKKKTWADWTLEEDILLTQVWAGSEPIKANVDLFPRHTYPAIIQHGHDLKLPQRRAGRSIKYNESLTMALLRRALEQKPMTCKQLAKVSGVSYRRAFEFIKVNRAGVHVAAWNRISPHGIPAAVWSWGAGEDMPLPKKVPLCADISELTPRARMDRDEQVDRKKARARKRYAEKNGKLIRRDSLVQAFFGMAAA